MKRFYLTILLLFGCLSGVFAETFSGSCTDEFRQTAWPQICVVAVSGTYNFSFGTGTIAGSNELAINGVRQGLECYPPGPLTGEIVLQAGDVLQALCAWDSLNWVLTLTLQGGAPQCPYTEQCVFCENRFDGVACGVCIYHHPEHSDADRICPTTPTCVVAPCTLCGAPAYCHTHVPHEHLCPYQTGVCHLVTCQTCFAEPYCSTHVTHNCAGACPNLENCNTVKCSNCDVEYCTTHHPNHVCNVVCPYTKKCFVLPCSKCKGRFCTVHVKHDCTTAPEHSNPPSCPLTETCKVGWCSFCEKLLCLTHHIRHTSPPPPVITDPVEPVIANMPSPPPFIAPVNSPPAVTPQVVTPKNVSVNGANSVINYTPPSNTTYTTNAPVTTNNSNTYNSQSGLTQAELAATLTAQPSAPELDSTPVVHTEISMPSSVRDTLFAPFASRYGTRSYVLTFPLSGIPSFGVLSLEDYSLDFADCVLTPYIVTLRQFELVLLTAFFFWFFMDIIRSFEY